MSRLDFKLEAQAAGSRARAARFRTLHNEVLTPLFMPVGTQATVKAQQNATLDASGSQILLANTYHLMLRPGADVFKKVGGIHPFMAWKKSVLTDSGGFQVFSLENSRTITEKGARFKSYIDESEVMLTPELSIEMQKAIGSDIMMVLDQCIPSTSDHKAAVDAMELTHRWALRSLNARGDSPQSMFGIVQGACYKDLRKRSAEYLTQLPFDGFAIGGLAVGEGRSEREDTTEFTAQLLPADRPRYLMGVGTPIDLLEAVHRGVDMFDCIIPTMYAQQGVVFTSKGRMELRRGAYRLSDEKLDPACACPTCAQYPRAYLHHLVKCQENLGWILLGAHNIYFYHKLMREMREAILNDTFYAYYLRKRVELVAKDEDYPITHPKKSKPPRRPSNVLNDYEIHEAAAGHLSIKHTPSGEVMHSVSAPEVEAQVLYIEQSRLLERLKEEGDALVIWDCGLGAASNAMAAVKCHQESGSTRPMLIVSFENNLDSLKLALRHAHAFKHLQHQAPHLLLKDGVWKSGAIEWRLVEGDFLETMAGQPAPDLIFFDLYSAKTHAEAWTIACWQKMLACCREKSTEVFTYTTSTAARASMLAAGWYVALGVATGPKAETTVALTRRESRFKLLDRDFLGRWERSWVRNPELDSTLSSHPQFV